MGFERDTKTKTTHGRGSSLKGLKNMFYFSLLVFKGIDFTLGHPEVRFLELVPLLGQVLTGKLRGKPLIVGEP